jgi:predicted transcriptional regulator
VSREQVARRTLKEMVGKLFAGSPREAIAFLLEDETLDPGELDEIRKMIDAYDDAEEDTR